jgi:hypothetical protein
MLTGNLNVTTFIGETVVLPCKVENLGNFHVNWLKIQDNIPMTLTVGYQQFSRNMRYRVARIHDSSSSHTNANTPRTESWNFEIRKVAKQDEGLYECYVKLNSKHKIKSNIYLNVYDQSDKKKLNHIDNVLQYNTDNCK